MAEEKPKILTSKLRKRDGSFVPIKAIPEAPSNPGQKERDKGVANRFEENLKKQAGQPKPEPSS